MTAPRVGRFVDVEGLVVDWLKAQLPEERSGTRPPDKFTGNFIWVTSVGGPADYDTTFLRVDLQYFTPGGVGASWPLAQAGHEAMGALDGQVVGDQAVYTVRCVAYPVRQFWSNDVDRTVSTYELELPVLG